MYQYIYKQESSKDFVSELKVKTKGEGPYQEPTRLLDIPWSTLSFLLSTYTFFQ